MVRRSHQFSESKDTAARPVIRGKRRYLAASNLTLFGFVAALLLVASPLPATAQVAQQAPNQLVKPAANDRIVARLIAQLMPKNHISAKGLDDTISQRALAIFTKSLDPLKLYFYQCDIDEFNRDARKIDDMVQKGDLSLAYKIFGRFIQRVDERVAVAQELLTSDFDFSKDETIVVDPEAAQYAKTPADAKDRWRRQIKYALLELKEEG